MKHSFWIAALLAALAAGPVCADDKLTGADAAYIDWATTNCGVKSTEKEHRLADAANEAGGPNFLKMASERSRKLAAIKSQSDQSDACNEIKAWYGPEGSRIAGLIEWTKEGRPVSVGKKSGGGEAAKSGGRKRGGG